MRTRDLLEHVAAAVYARPHAIAFETRRTISDVRMSLLRAYRQRLLDRADQGGFVYWLTQRGADRLNYYRSQPAPAEPFTAFFAGGIES